MLVLLTSGVMDLLIQVSDIFGSIHSVRYAALCCEFTIPCSQNIFSAMHITVNVSMVLASQYQVLGS